MDSDSARKRNLTNKNDVPFSDRISHSSIDLTVGEDEQLLTPKFSFFSILALAFCVLGTWSTLAQNLGGGLTSGGPAALLWGLCIVGICNVCVALSLAELCSAMPTTLGQAYYIDRLCASETGRFISYICAWINTFGWWTLTASQAAFVTNLMLGMRTMIDPDWNGASTPWLQFTVYIVVVGSFTLVNAMGCRSQSFLPYFNDISGTLFAVLFVVFSVTLLVCVGTKEDLSFRPASWVFGAWINQTGWPTEVVLFTSLVHAAYGLTAFDSVIHLVEEMPSPRTNAPKAIYLSVVVGAISGFIFLLVCLFCIQDVGKLQETQSGSPFLQLILDATGYSGAFVLLSLFVLNALGAGVSIATTGSRLTWGFARDGGLPFFEDLVHVSTTWRAPLRAIWLQGVIVALIGILYFLADMALVAVLSVSTIALTISYGLPIAVLLAVGRTRLPEGNFELGRFGPLLNWISVIYCAITTVFFFFPRNPHPSLPEMNWAVAVFSVMILVAMIFWGFQGQNTYLKTADAEGRMLLAKRLEITSYGSSEETY